MNAGSFMGFRGVDWEIYCIRMRKKTIGSVFRKDLELNDSKRLIDEFLSKQKSQL